MIKVNKKSINKILPILFLVALTSVVPSYKVDAATLYNGYLTVVYNLDKSSYSPGEYATLNTSMSSEQDYGAFRIISHKGTSLMALFPGDFNYTDLIRDNVNRYGAFHWYGSKQFQVPSSVGIKTYSLTLSTTAVQKIFEDGITYGPQCGFAQCPDPIAGSTWDIPFTTWTQDSFSVVNAAALTLEPYVDNGLSRNGASPSSAIKPGETTYLLWDSVNADYCMFNGQTYGTSRNIYTAQPITLSPSVTTSYSVSCYNDND